MEREPFNPEDNPVTRFLEKTAKWLEEAGDHISFSMRHPWLSLKELRSDLKASVKGKK